MTFIKGTYKLDRNITDLQEYEDSHSAIIQKIMEFAQDADFQISFDLLDDDCYGCMYEITGKNYTACQKLHKELFSKLRDKWKKMERVFEYSGDC